MRESAAADDKLIFWVTNEVRFARRLFRTRAFVDNSWDPGDRDLAYDERCRRDYADEMKKFFRNL